MNCFSERNIVTNEMCKVNDELVTWFIDVHKRLNNEAKILGDCINSEELINENEDRIFTGGGKVTMRNKGDLMNLVNSKNLQEYTCLRY